MLKTTLLYNNTKYIILIRLIFLIPSTQLCVLSPDEPKVASHWRSDLTASKHSCDGRSLWPLPCSQSGSCARPLFCMASYSARPLSQGTTLHVWSDSIVQHDQAEPTPVVCPMDYQCPGLHTTYLLMVLENIYSRTQSRHYTPKDCPASWLQCRLKHHAPHFWLSRDQINLTASQTAADVHLTSHQHVWCLYRRPWT